MIVASTTRMALVMPENTAGRKFSESYGLRPAGYLHSLRVAGFRRDWFSPAPGTDHRSSFRLAPHDGAE